MKQSEIKEFSTEELLERLEDQQGSLAKLKLNHKVSELENPLSIRAVRKNVARLKTEINKRKQEDK